jgi:hypothetical protein
MVLFPKNIVRVSELLLTEMHEMLCGIIAMLL